MRTSALLLLFHILFSQGISAYTGWPGGLQTKDLGKEALNRQKAGDLDLALLLHEKILKLEPCNVWSFEKLGDMKQKQKNYEAAIIFYKKAQQTIKCNTTKHVELDDYVRISKKIKESHELKKETEPREKELKPSRFHKGENVSFQATSMLFHHKYTIKGIIVTPGSNKSRVKIIDNGGSIYIKKEIYLIENAIMKKLDEK